MAKKYLCFRMGSTCIVGEALEAFVPFSLLTNSGRYAAELKASGDLFFSVSMVSRDVMRCSCSYSHYGKLWSLCFFINTSSESASMHHNRYAVSKDTFCKQ